MKKILLLIALVALSSLWVVAQTDTSNPQDQGTGATQNSQSSTQTNTQTTTDQTGASQTQAPDQSGAAAGQAGAADQNAAGANAQKSRGGNLPQTASPLPLLGLLGMGGLTAGIVSRKRRK